MSPRPKLFVTRAIPEAGLKLLKSDFEVEVSAQDAPIDREALLRGVADATALLCMLTDRVDAELLAAAPRLRMVANYAVGTNNLDLEALRARGVSASNTPDVLTAATADLAWGLLLDAARGISSGDRVTRRGEFGGWGPLYRLGREVSGKTLGLVGYGRIGQAVALRAQGFGMKVLYHQRHPLTDSLGARWTDLDTLLKESDFISLHCPLSDSTHHLIGARELDLMKREAVLVNTSRGPVVDEAALVTALREGRIFGAGLDVYEREPLLAEGLAELENVVLAPHLGSATVETRDAMAVRAAENLLALIHGDAPKDAL